MTTPHTGTEGHATSTINANRCAMWDNGATKEKRPQGHTVLSHRPQGLTHSSGISREGLAMKATLRPLAHAPRPAVSVVAA